MGIVVDNKAFLGLISRVWLGGIIEECVLEVREGVGKIQAVDTTNCMFLVSEVPIKGMEDTTIGVSSLSILCRFFSNSGPDKVILNVVEGKWLVLERQGHGSVRLLLIEPDLVSTAFSSVDARQKALVGCAQHMELTKQLMDDFLYCTDLLKSQRVNIEVRERKIYITSGNDEINQFRVELGDTEAAEFVIQVHADKLISVVKALDWTVGEKPQMFFGDGVPLVIQQGELGLWALIPVGE